MLLAVAGGDDDHRRLQPPRQLVLRPRLSVRQHNSDVDVENDYDVDNNAAAGGGGDKRRQGLQAVALVALQLPDFPNGVRLFCTCCRCWPLQHRKWLNRHRRHDATTNAFHTAGAAAAAAADDDDGLNFAHRRRTDEGMFKSAAKSTLSGNCF